MPVKDISLSFSFNPAGDGKQLGNFEQENDMIRLIFYLYQRYASWQLVEERMKEGKIES